MNVYVQVGSDTTLNDALRVKALSCITFLIKLKSKVGGTPTIKQEELIFNICFRNSIYMPHLSDFFVITFYIIPFTTIILCFLHF